MIPKINKAFKVDETITAMAMNKGYGRRQISKRSNYLDVRVATPGTALVPPKAEIGDVPFEVWIYPPISEDELEEQVSNFWDEAPDELINMIPQDVDIGEANPEENVKMSVEGGWTVLRVGDFDSIKEMMEKRAGSAPTMAVGN